MKLTKALKDWLSKNCGVPADASDDEFRKAASAAIMDGKLESKTLHELTSESPAPETKGESLGDKLLKRFDSLDQRLEKLEKKNADPNEPAGEGDPPAEGATEGTDTAAGSGGVDLNGFTKSLTTAITDGMKSALSTVNPRQNSSGNGSGYSEDGPTPVKLFTQTDEGTQNAKDVRVRVKSAVEQYDGTKTKAVYSADCKHLELRGKQAHTGVDGHYLDMPSRLDRAISGAWFKFRVNVACKEAGILIPRCYKLTEHDNDLVRYALHEMPFVGGAGVRGEDREPEYVLNGQRKNSDLEIKAILDDSTSGGLEAAPIVFDDDLIRTPILYGEIYPLVTVINLTRGRRVEGFSIGTPTITSGTPEGTAIGLFNTASFIAAFDTTIFNAVGAIELGKDFEDDSPVNIGDQVMSLYGEAMLAWLDEQIVIGDGTIEPEGIFVASGTNAISSDNSTSGPPTLGDYEGLLFGVAKKYKPAQDRQRCIYVSNETTYRRSRAMKVDPQSTGRDERRLLGLDHENYMTLGHPHKINEQIPNGKVGFFNARRYRLYRRQGTTMSITDQGKDLTLRNVRLISLRARFGGHLEDGDACAIMTDAQS